MGLRQEADAVGQDHAAVRQAEVAGRPPQFGQQPAARVGHGGLGHLHPARFVQVALDRRALVVTGRWFSGIAVLHAAARLVRPRRYLEIGVFRGRSLAVVASQALECELYCFDLWIEN